MAKRTLIGAYIYQGETYGPGEVELPQDSERFVAIIDKGEERERQKLSERMASTGIDPTAFGLPEAQLSNTQPPDAEPVTVPTVESAPVPATTGEGDQGAASTQTASTAKK